MSTSEQPRTTGWTPVVGSIALGVALGATIVGLTLGTGLGSSPRWGHIAGHLTFALPSGLVAVLAWQRWPRPLPTRLSSLGATVLRVALVIACVGNLLEALGGLTAADPDGSTWVHDVGMVFSVPGVFGVVAGLGLLLLGGLCTAAGRLWRKATGRQRHAGGPLSGSMA